MNPKEKHIQRDREIEVYPESIKAAQAIMEKTVFTGLVWPGTRIDLYIAEIITEAIDGTLE